MSFLTIEISSSHSAKLKIRFGICQYIYGNQILMKTSTGIWEVAYNAANRPVTFTKAEENTVTIVTCTYDSMGRRAAKKVEVITASQSGESMTSVTLHQRYLYRDYLQIACCDLTDSFHPCLWLITWDPTEPVSTRPLAIQKDGTWYTYGLDLTKNIWEVFNSSGMIATTYRYEPYGAVTAEGDVIQQPVQWSSEYYDNELDLVYDNYRHYNPNDGRWINRDSIDELGGWNLYGFIRNNIIGEIDALGLNSPRDPSGWSTALMNFLSWLSGNVPPYTFYLDGSEESNTIKGSCIGRDIEKYFKEKNKNAKYCRMWENMTNISITFPGWDTIFSFSKERINKDFTRFLESLDNGIVFFVASCRGDVYVEIMHGQNGDYVDVSYKVTNTTSLTSFALHLLPSLDNGWPLGNWTQVYEWKEKINCCEDRTPVEIQSDKEIEQMMNSFPYNTNPNDIYLPSNYFGSIPSL